MRNQEDDALLVELDAAKVVTDASNAFIEDEAGIVALELVDCCMESSYNGWTSLCCFAALNSTLKVRAGALAADRPVAESEMPTFYRDVSGLVTRPCCPVVRAVSCSKT